MSEKKPFVPYELQELIALGKQGLLWTIQVVYTLDGSTETITKRNLTDPELMKFRDKMFQFGITKPLDAGHWRVICPLDIVRVDLYRQKSYFPDVPGGFPVK